MRISTWDDERDPVVRSALGRLETLYPDLGNTQTHLLHLASSGEIRPHVDNIGASGSWILGVSLGSERILRMESVEEDLNGVQKCAFDLMLPSGSVYIQNIGASHGQRLSIMIRVRLSLPYCVTGEAVVRHD
ncbi:hypothetical protein BGW80DRAFT_1269368 [Lactifluus volemus]|nr:hypothetical protein BGW80DRAFT_1269368 [Lactifluus volemus]